MSDEERIRTDREVVLIRAAIDEGIAELDAGLGEEMTVEDSSGSHNAQTSTVDPTSIKDDFPSRPHPLRQTRGGAHRVAPASRGRIFTVAARAPVEIIDAR